MKYGVKIPFILDHDYMWVVHGDSKFQLEPILFEDKHEAEEYALNVWGKNAIVEVYGESKNTF